MLEIGRAYQADEQSLDGELIEHRRKVQILGPRDHSTGFCYHNSDGFLPSHRGIEPKDPA